MVNPKHHDWAAFQMLLSIKLLLSAGRNISSKKWLCDLMKALTLQRMIFHSQLRIKLTFGEKRTVMENKDKRFLFKCPNLHISKTNSERKTENHLIQRYVAWISEFGNTYICTNVDRKVTNITIAVKNRKFLPCYKAKFTFCSRSLQEK